MINVTLGYLFTAINYVCYCGSRFAKKKYQMLMLDVVAKIFTIMGLYFMGSMSGAYSFCVGLVLLIVALYKEKTGKRWTLGYILFQSIYLLILIFTFAGVSSVLVFISSTITLICIWWLSPQNMRLLGLSCSVVYTTYQVTIRNWAGLLELAVMFSNIVSYLVYRRREKEACAACDKSE